MAESDSSSAFASGCNNFRIESIRSHEKATGHCLVVAATKVTENPCLAPLPHALLNMSQDLAQKMERLFDISFFIAKREMTFTSFPRLCHLEIKNGVELGAKYVNGKACKNFVCSIILLSS